MVIKKWTQEEDNILIGYIRSNIGNINKGLIEASEDLGRTKNSCSNRWYKKLSKLDNHRSGITYVTLSNTSYIKNKKIASTNKTINKRFTKIVKDFLIKLLSL